MRQIEVLMNQAVQSKLAMTQNNTSVSYDKWLNVSRVYLHGNHIATMSHDFSPVKGYVMLDTLRDYPTRTTCSRLTALGFKVNVKQGLIYLDGEAI